ncbi:Tyr recombinase domain-containing protein OS=Streptomyces griseomycini OX=66895 GN=FHS37_003453 PE=4 SV=1 [Streptomyces griseomycini]|uniref:Tyr recombinase domain-containing protein n=1 Tax=Streptomyces griseomycini TaxID=66895 RepID=A0A7W7LZJ6_9ACTN|nr:hypothetical protein [Streptomyces griseomycini]GGR36064.1 hypothetical protein GCM10015536_47340 [Streptomyces griseomycini]
MPCGRTEITVYGLRHAYAQRHADAGVPVDRLRELMDHREIDTTMGYFKVSPERKRKAVETVAQLTVDRHGNPRGYSDVLAYEGQTVAVPYGGCSEPSNVKAGGRHRRIRFQCAGCDFYRPDPSYLPALQSSRSPSCGPARKQPWSWAPPTVSSATSTIRSPATTRH